MASLDEKLCDDVDAELSHADRELVFRIATRGLPHHYADELSKGMTDNELEQALERCLGIFGGSGGPGQPNVTYKGSGLRIWGGWRAVNHVKTKPLFQGRATMEMARAVYGIKNPLISQLDLF